MIIILEYEIDGQLPRKVWLGRSQSLTVGCARRADVEIDSDPALADVHFSVMGTDHQWQIAALRPENRVAVNGTLVTTHTLQHGDLVQAGNTRFRVSVEGEAAGIRATDIGTALTDTPALSTPVAETQPLNFFAELLASKMIQFSLEIQNGSTVEVLRELALHEPCVGCNWYVLINAKRFRDSVEPLGVLGEDLLSQAPVEIRETDSLHAVQISPEFEPPMFELLMAAAHADAACLVASPLDYEHFLEQHRLVLAWLTRPSILAMQVTQGTEMLASKIISAHETMVVFKADSEVRLFVNGEQNADDLLRNSLQQIHIPSQVTV